MTLYRTAFHRIRGFPGPAMAKVTKFWHVSKVLDSSNYKLMEELHKKYGDIVRTGPNELTIFKPEAVPALDGPGTKCTKTLWYDVLYPRVSVATTRDKSIHKKRRQIWDHAFSVQALQGYESRLQVHAQQLDDRITASIRNPIDISSLFYLYTFDVMGDLAFGISFSMLKDDGLNDAIKILQDGMSFLGPFTPIPWAFRMGLGLPWVARSFKRLARWSEEQLQIRLKSDENKRDLMYWLLEDFAKNPQKGDYQWLRGDSLAIVVAGSDTIASTLTSLFYHLAHDTTQVQKLRAEMKSLDSVSNPKILQGLAHLNGVVNETLRLHPALPTGGIRETPPEGLTIAGQYIPGKVAVLAPRYSLCRLESCFERAEEFIPERWYSEPQMIKDKRAFSPFSMGRYSCVGKNLAMIQLRSVVALLVSKFDVRFAPGEEGVAVWRDLRDQYNAHPGKLEMVFTPRAGV